MRSTTEQLQEVLRRAEILRKKRAVQKRMIPETISALCCVLLLIAVSCDIPQFRVSPADLSPRNYGSMIHLSPAAVYIVIGILAFALGVCVTLLCQHCKRLKELTIEKEKNKY